MSNALRAVLAALSGLCAFLIVFVVMFVPVTMSAASVSAALTLLFGASLAAVIIAASVWEVTGKTTDD